MRAHATGELIVATRGFLVHEHLLAERFELVIMHHAGERAERGRRLVAEFVGEARRVVEVLAVVHTVPHIPDVHGSVDVLVGVGELGEAHRGARQVDVHRVEFGQQGREEIGVIVVAQPFLRTRTALGALSSSRRACL